MRKRLLFMLLIGACAVSLGLVAVHESGAQMTKMPVVKNMDITGEIAKTDNGYIIRGKKPAEIFTILNPEPAILDGLGSKIVHLKVKVVSGDNIEIEKIDGKSYGKTNKTVK